KRHLAGNSEELDRKSGTQCMRCFGLRDLSADGHRIKHAEYRIAVENVVNAVRRVNRKLMTFAQGKKAADMIDVPIGQDDVMHRAASYVVPRLEKGISGDLLAYVGRAVEEAPRL